MGNELYLGIDQTGARNARGQPKPLPACLLVDGKVSFFYLDSLSLKDLSKHIPSAQHQQLLTCIDCVLGLPVELRLPWREALELLEGYEGYGRKPAQEYFRALSKNHIYRRKVELLCRANSVFQEKPYQKNIQTGTFRFWKDLIANSRDFYVPALETRTRSNQLPLFEGYPSHSWKILLGTKHRRPESLSELIHTNKIKVVWNQVHQESVNKDPNLADAFLLALTIKTLKEEALQQTPHPEGWILGAAKVF